MDIYKTVAHSDRKAEHGIAGLMMDSVNVTINGMQLTGKKGMTILELSVQNGIDIPTLCYRPELTPLGAMGFIPKRTVSSQLLAGIRCVSKGEHFTPRSQN